MFRIMLLLLTVFVFADNPEKQNRGFKHQNKSYSYSLSFTTSLNRDSVLAVLYSFDHLKRYSSGTSQTHFLCENGNNSYEFEIYLKHLFYATKSVYKRTIFPDSGIIKIELSEFKDNSSMFPSITYSFSEYRVISSEINTVIKYRQTVSFDKKLNRLYSSTIRARLDKFSDDLIGYINGLCVKRQKLN